MKGNTLIQVLLAMALAVIAGWWVGPNTQIFGVNLVKIFDLIGQLFLNALYLVLVPLVVSSIITGTARIGSEKSFGKLGAKTFGFFFLTNFIAILVGTLTFLIATSWISSNFLPTPPSTTVEIATQSKGFFDNFVLLLLKIIPSNILAAASQGQVLSLILFSILFGYFLNRIEAHAASVVLGFWKGVFQVMMQITHLVMRALPIGVFGLVAKVVATTGIESITSLAIFFVIIIVGLLIYSLVIIPLLLIGIGRVNPMLHFRAVGPALLTAFSTSSSAATLPVTLECVEKRAGVSNRICSFILPLGTNLNLSGSAMHSCVASLFIAMTYGVPLTFGTVAMIVMMATVLSFSIAGIPSASIIAILVILQAIGVPAEGVGVIMAIERIVDMCRTAVNVLSDTVSTVLVARTEGETDVLNPVLISPQVEE